MNLIELAAKCERLETELSEANRRLASYEIDGTPCNGCGLKSLYEKCPDCNKLNNALIDKLSQYVEVLKVECAEAKAVAKQAMDIIKEHQGELRRLM